MSNKLPSSPTREDIIQELAVSAALAALCGGSGVGQAPELPQKADILFLPKAPAELQYHLVLGEKITPEQETRIELREIGEVREVGVVGPPSPAESAGFGEARARVLKKIIFWVSVAFLIVGALGIMFTYGPIVRSETRYQLKNLTSVIGSRLSVFGSKFTSFRFVSFKTEKQKTEKLISENRKQRTDNRNNFEGIKFVADSAIAIPKIDAYAEITINVDPANYEEYMAALQKGVAHASGTALPTEAGNSYLFAHSAGNLWDMARFNAVFYLISKLEKGDAIYVKFGNRKAKYAVYDKREVEPSETKYLTAKNGGGRTLVLQTCTPAGTDWRRLLVFARVEE